MDGGGRLDQPLMRSGQSSWGEAGTPHDAPARARVDAAAAAAAHGACVAACRLSPLDGTRGRREDAQPLPPGIGIAASVLLLAGALGYGAVAAASMFPA